MQNEFPHTKTVIVKGSAPFDPRANDAPILAELRKQTAYMKRIDKLVSLFWAALIGLISLVIVAGVFWFVAESVIR